MKKILTTIALLAVIASSAFAQGTIAVYSISSSFAIYTNNATYTTADNGVYNITGGKTASTANAFYYALLFMPYTNGSTINNPLAAPFTLGMMATNLSTGGIRGSGAAAGAAVTGWAAPTDATYGTAAEMNYLLVGWSSSLGTAWSTVSAELNSGNWAANGFFGVSSLGYSYAGGGPNTLSAVNIFGVSTGAPGGLPNGITLFAVAPAGVPEPSTMALAGLGGAALLLFRRRTIK